MSSGGGGSTLQLAVGERRFVAVVELRDRVVARVRAAASRRLQQRHGVLRRRPARDAAVIGSERRRQRQRGHARRRLIVRRRLLVVQRRIVRFQPAQRVDRATARAARRAGRAPVPLPSERRRSEQRDRRARSADMEPSARRSSGRPAPRWSAPVPPPDRDGNNYGGRDGYYDTATTIRSATATDTFAVLRLATTATTRTGSGMGYGLYSGFGWVAVLRRPVGDPYGGGYGYGGGSSSSYGRGEQGNLKLKVKPRAAKVYVDGYFVGTVDEFDGAFQKLALNTGRHKVEVKADGFETAEFDVLINPEQTVTFQGELKRIQ